jgi:hypothetical protein
MLIEEANQLLQPGYMPIETGYYRLQNGHMHVRVLTRMPRCRGKMVDWWFGYLDGTEKYQMWEPKSHMSLKWDEHWKPGHYIGANMFVEEDVGGRLRSIRIQFHEPSDFLDTSQFQEANVGAAICAKSYELDDTPAGMLIHFIRDTDFGCEMRSRFWLYEAPDIAGPGLMIHCLEEMGHLADILPDLYKKENIGE